MGKPVKIYFIKAVKIAVILLAALMFVLSALIMLGSIFKNDKQLAPWGTGFFTIISGSMEPAIPAGSIVFAREVAAEEIKTGDIITYFAVNGGTEVVTHRVKDITGDSRFITRGDANNTDDSPISYEQVIGRVMFKIPGVVFFRNVMQSANLLGAVMLCGGLILFFLGVFSNLIKKNKPEESAVKEENIL